MAKKYIRIPEPIKVQGVAYTHVMLLTHFLDTAKRFQSPSAARIGFKILDAAEKAVEASDSYYAIDAEWWKILHEVSEDENLILPTFQRVGATRDGTPIVLPADIGMFHYLPLLDPIDKATDTEPMDLVPTESKASS